MKEIFWRYSVTQVKVYVTSYLLIVAHIMVKYATNVILTMYSFDRNFIKIRMVRGNSTLEAITFKSSRRESYNREHESLVEGRV